MSKSEIKQHLRKKLKQYHLSSWQIGLEVFTEEDNCCEWGRCDYDLKTYSALISIRTDLSDEETINTINHECFHLLLAELIDATKLPVKYLGETAAGLYLEQLATEEEKFTAKLTRIFSDMS